MAKTHLETVKIREAEMLALQGRLYPIAFRKRQKAANEALAASAGSSTSKMKDAADEAAFLNSIFNSLFKEGGVNGEFPSEFQDLIATTEVGK